MKNAKTQTNDTNADAEVQNAFSDGLREELAGYAQRAARRYEKAKAEFLERLATNPADAITWVGEDMAMAQGDHEVWMQVAAELEQHDPREVLRETIKDVRNRIRRFFGGSSTSQFRNAVERAKAEGHARLADELDNIAAHFGL